MLPAHVVAVVLLAAVLHAGWNVAVRAGRDRRRESALMLVGGAVLAILLLPFLPALPRAAWPYVLISSLLNGVSSSLWLKPTHMVASHSPIR